MKGAIAVGILFLSLVANAQHDPLSAITYDERYTDALKAYTTQRWTESVPYFRQAVDDYAREEKGRRKCYETCRGEGGRALDTDAEGEFFQRVVQRSSCIERCKEDFVGVRPAGGVPSYIEDHMKKREAYNYLQMALYQVS